MNLLVRARFVWLDWVGAHRPPGRRVVARVRGVEIERLWGGGMGLHSGAWLRARGWRSAADDRIERCIVSVPWTRGSLIVMVAAARVEA